MYYKESRTQELNRGDRELSTQDPLGVTTIGARRGTEIHLLMGVTRCKERHRDEQ